MNSKIAIVCFTETNKESCTQNVFTKWEQIKVEFGKVQKGVLEMANEAAMDARKESKLLQDMVAAEKKNKSKKKRAPGKDSSMGKLAKQGKRSKTDKRMKKTKKAKTRGDRRIEKIYGHELYKGADYEECGAEWFHIQYSNGDKECVTAVVVADEVPEMGADYILDNCLDDEEDRSSFGDWLSK